MERVALDAPLIAGMIQEAGGWRCKRVRFAVWQVGKSGMPDVPYGYCEVFRHGSGSNSLGQLTTADRQILYQDRGGTVAAAVDERTLGHWTVEKKLWPPGHTRVEVQVNGSVVCSSEFSRYVRGLHSRQIVLQFNKGDFPKVPCQLPSVGQGRKVASTSPIGKWVPMASILPMVFMDRVMGQNAHSDPATFFLTRPETVTPIIMLPEAMRSFTEDEATVVIACVLWLTVLM